MRIKNAAVPIAALTLAFGSFSAEAAQRPRGSQQKQKDEARDRGTQAQRPQTQRQERQRDDSAAPRGEKQMERGGQSDRGWTSSEQNRDRQSNRDRQPDRASADRDRDRDAAAARRPRPDDNRASRDNRDSRDNRQSRPSAPQRDYDRNRSNNDRYDNRNDNRNDYRGGYSGGYSRGYYAPRLIPRRQAPRRYYGSGGHLSLYFSIGSGYRYGSPYSGRIYGYRRTPVYSVRQYYGDLRLRVSPRDAAVYVDGYYAGIVDDFDGFFQRLTLEVGPHRIEIEAPGLESQVFDVYVDQYNTVDLHADLLR